MKTAMLDSVLNEWNIKEEAQRWSLKEGYLQDNPKHISKNEFVHFLKRNHIEKKNISYPIRKAFKKMSGFLG